MSAGAEKRVSYSEVHMCLHVVYAQAYSSRLPVPVRNRQPSIPAKSARRNLHSWGCLAALVFAGIHHAHYPLDRLALKTHRHKLLKAAVIFGICLQNWVKYIIRRQAIGILLAWTQFGRRRLVDY